MARYSKELGFTGMENAINDPEFTMSLFDLLVDMDFGINDRKETYGILLELIVNKYHNG